ncbi:MAG: hypothetical protein ABIY51_09375 [Ferruginibacter sp.]
MTLFKIAWAVDAIVSITIIYFFVEGLLDGTVGTNNLGVWLLILCFLIAILCGSIWLKTHHHGALGLQLLLILAIPALLFVLYFGLALLNNERWN